MRHRHYNPTMKSYFYFRNCSRPYICNKPYQRNYKYTHPTAKCWYVKILQYVYDHPNCKRVEILHGIFPHWFKTVDDAKKYGRGHASTTFANMLYDDLIDYDKAYRYTITSRGKEILRRYYEMNMAKFVTAKA